MLIQTLATLFDDAALSRPRLARALQEACVEAWRWSARRGGTATLCEAVAASLPLALDVDPARSLVAEPAPLPGEPPSLALHMTRTLEYLDGETPGGCLTLGIDLCCRLEATTPAVDPAARGGRACLATLLLTLRQGGGGARAFHEIRRWIHLPDRSTAP